MAIYEDGTMDVLKDGRVERRKYEVQMHNPLMDRRMPPPPINVTPVLEEGEQVMFYLGKDVPHVVRVKWPDPRLANALRDRPHPAWDEQ